MSNLVERTTRMLRIPADVKVQCEHEEEDLRAEIDRDQIAQVLTNLVNNAVDAMPEGGTLTLQTGGHERSIWIQVHDTGCGIPPENRKKIFEPFFTTKGASKGTGLGLSVTYGIVKMHQGDIKVESNADPQAGPTGTTFTVTLPRQRTLTGEQTIK
jgi:signal transduction histidine kinase